jgi:hypothetical protein
MLLAADSEQPVVAYRLEARKVLLFSNSLQFLAALLRCYSIVAGKQAEVAAFPI